MEIAPDVTRTSPDGNWEALIENYNVFLRKTGEAKTMALSFDGSRRKLLCKSFDPLHGRLIQSESSRIAPLPDINAKFIMSNLRR